VGAGAGSYEPRGRRVVAFEPSRVMIAQRPPGAAPCVQASASALPLRRAAVDASLAILTLHHWPDRERGLRELARVASERVVLLTWMPGAPFWLTDDYFPEIVRIDRELFPSLGDLRRVLGPLEVEPVPIPHDCSDGFLGAYWRRPRAYLDPRVRGAISGFARIGDAGPGLLRLARDLERGDWEARHGALLELEALDLGYRVVCARAAASPGFRPRRRSADGGGSRAGSRTGC
jgi:SAM-dependent methyltransferase